LSNPEATATALIVTAAVMGMGAVYIDDDGDEGPGSVPSVV
jgi:hypothetical protein